MLEVPCIEPNTGGERLHTSGTAGNIHEYMYSDLEYSDIYLRI